MKILLLYPEFPDTFWSFKHALKFLHKKASLPPLGLLTVAAMLPSKWEKRLVDLNVSKLREKDLEWADCAFISAMLVQRQAAHRLISLCKKHGLTIVAGGPLFTSEHESFAEVDHFVLNEAELTLPPFLIDFRQGIAGRIYSTKDFVDIRKSPVPIWGLLKKKSYASMSIQYSRGCPFHCEFCNVTVLFGHRSRVKPAVKIIAELDGLYRQLKWRGGIFFVDDNFIGNKNHLKKEILPALINWKRDKAGISFFTEASINLADDEELMRMMVRAGFDTVFIGIETPSESGLAECNKKQNRNRDMIADVKKIQRFGMQVQGGFIVGFDSDTPLIFQQQLDFIQKSGIVTAMVGMLQAPLGTRLYERLQKEGRLQTLFSGDNADGTTNIIPTMSLETLRDGYKKLLDNIYSPDHYYQRVRTFLREYKPPRNPVRLDFQHQMAFLRSILHIGILGRERFHYWKLLLWTNFHRPRLFPLAVTLAIYGHHFRKVCKLHIV